MTWDSKDQELRVRLVAKKLKQYPYDLISNWLGIPSYKLPENRTLYRPILAHIHTAKDVMWLESQVIVKLTNIEQDKLCQLINKHTNGIV